MIPKSGNRFSERSSHKTTTAEITSPPLHKNKSSGSGVHGDRKADVVIVDVGAVVCSPGKAGMKVIGLERGPLATKTPPRRMSALLPAPDLRPDVKRQP
jgi:hypothetical protein